MSGQDILMGGGKAPASLDFGRSPGARKGGRVVAGPTEYHCREYNPLNPGQGEFKYFPDGNPIKGVYIDVQTDERDPSNPEDDGIRRIYAEKPRMLAAIRDAIKATGATELEHGGGLWLIWTGTEPSKGGQPANTYAAQYTRPGAAALMGAPATQQHQPSAAPAQQYVPLVHRLAEAQHAYQPQTPEPQYVNPFAPQQVQPAPVQHVRAAQPVPAAVYNAMANAGMDVSGFVPIPGA